MATWRENRRLTEDVLTVADEDLVVVTSAYNRLKEELDRDPTKDELIEKINKIRQSQGS